MADDIKATIWPPTTAAWGRALQKWASQVENLIENGRLSRGAYEAGRFYAPPYAFLGNAGAGPGLTAFVPFIPVNDFVVDGAGILAGTGPAGRMMTFGIYDSDSATVLDQPFTKLAESSPVDMNVAPNPAYKFVSGPLVQPCELRGGHLYWLTGYQNQGGNFRLFAPTSTATSVLGVPPQGFRAMSELSGGNPYPLVEWSGAIPPSLPATIPPANLAWGHYNAPAIWLRAA